MYFTGYEDIVLYVFHQKHTALNLKKKSSQK